MNTRILGIIGSVLLIVGLFCPIISIFGVSVSYFDTMGSGYSDGYIFAGLGVISLIIALININRILILTGLVSLGMIAIAYVGFKSKMSESSANQLSNLAISFGWGWGVLGLGGILLLVAGIMKKSVPAAPTGYGAPPPPAGYGPPPGYPPGPGQPPPYNR